MQQSVHRHWPAGKFQNGDQIFAKPLKTMARATGLEPAASGVTGRRSNQLSYARKDKNARRDGRVRVRGGYAREGAKSRAVRTLYR